MSVLTRGKILYIDFRFYLPNGRKVRCRESTGLVDNQKNLKQAKQKDKAIDYHLKSGSFKYLDFFPDGSKAKYFRQAYTDLLFSTWWETWLGEKSLRPNTQKNWDSSYRVHIEPYFGSYLLKDINEHEVLVFCKS